MKKCLYTVEETNRLLKEGKKLIIAGSHNYLRLLEQGGWIGGSAYYCFAEGKGIESREFLFVQEIPPYCKEIEIKCYDINSLENIYLDMFDNGFCIILIPFESKTHFKYPVEVINYPLFATKPLLGWISGIPLDNEKNLKAIVYDGWSKQEYYDGAVVMHVKLPDNKLADVKVCNVFEAAGKYELEFNEEGFNIEKVSVNGKEQNFIEFIKEKNIDIRFPLVGTLFNAIPTIVSFKEINEKEKKVKLYAPVYKGIKYDLAKQEESYYDMLIKNIQIEDNFILPNLCVLHFVYAELQKKHTDKIPNAPATFGEIAHILVNQTLAYLSIYDV
jgi:hypothetical protein